MGCRILVGGQAGTTEAVACMFDSVTEQVFGPLFRDYADAHGEIVDAEDAAHSFVYFCLARGKDPRGLQPKLLDNWHSDWLCCTGQIQRKAVTA